MKKILFVVFIVLLIIIVFVPLVLMLIDARRPHNLNPEPWVGQYPPINSPVDIEDNSYIEEEPISEPIIEEIDNNYVIDYPFYLDSITNEINNKKASTVISNEINNESSYSPLTSYMLMSEATSWNNENNFNEATIKSDSKGIYADISDDIILNNEEIGQYRGKEELLPAYLVLKPETIEEMRDNSLYPILYTALDGQTYEVPAYYCSNDADEAIVYKDNLLIIMRSTGNISAFGKDIKTNYTYDEKSKEIKENVKNLFECYFGQDEEYKYTYRAFKEDEDTISFVAYDKLAKDAKTCSLCRIFLKSVAGSIEKSVAPVYIGSHMASFGNVYYSNKTYSNFPFNKLVEENIPFSYILYHDSSFHEVFRLPNGEIATESDSFTNQNFKLISDFGIIDYPIDGKYNKDSGDVPFIAFQFKNTEDKIIEKDTPISITKVLDKYRKCYN